MKFCRILPLFVTFILPPLALGKLPFSNDTFGKLEGTLDFCAQVDPESATKYADQKKQLVRGVSDAELSTARDTQQYKGAYEWVSTELRKLPKDQAVGTCRQSLEGR